MSGAMKLVPSSGEELAIATPSSRRRVDGVEVDAMSQHERVTNFEFHTGPVQHFPREVVVGPHVARLH